MALEGEGRGVVSEGWGMGSGVELGGSVDVPPLSPYPDDMATCLVSGTTWWIAGERGCVVPLALALV
jgi:hypothetical protein